MRIPALLKVRLAPAGAPCLSARAFVARDSGARPVSGRRRRPSARSSSPSEKVTDSLRAFTSSTTVVSSSATFGLSQQDRLAKYATGVSTLLKGLRSRHVTRTTAVSARIRDTRMMRTRLGVPECSSVGRSACRPTRPVRPRRRSAGPASLRRVGSAARLGRVDARDQSWSFAMLCHPYQPFARRARWSGPQFVKSARVKWHPAWLARCCLWEQC
jgi:hypothetical protein